MTAEAAQAQGGMESLQVIFRYAGERYAVPLSQVREVAPMPDPVPVPRAPDFVRGVVSVHGRIVTVIELKPFLRSRAPEPAGGEILVLARDDTLLAVRAEHVERIAPLPQVGAGEGAVVPSAVGLVTCLDLNRLLGGIEAYFA